MGKTVTVICPECDADVYLTEPIRCGDRVRCPRCHSRLVVVGLAPLKLDWAFLAPTGDPASMEGGETPAGQGDGRRK